MDKTYLHIYKALYQHLYKFCIAGTMDSKKAVKDLERMVSDAKDINLEYLYQIVLSAIDMEKDKFEQRSRDFKLQNRSFMTILKGYSSSTPFFYPALKERFHNVPIKGGGIYIKWRVQGL